MQTCFHRSRSEATTQKISVMETSTVPKLFTTGVFVHLLLFVRGANWAETNGVKMQNNAIVRASPFAARYGHACAAVDTGPQNFDYVESAENVGLTSRSVDALICIGGDDYNEVTGGGGLKNDVWRTHGIDFRVAQAYTILNEYSEPRTSTISNMIWDVLSPQKYPPATVSYNTWIACSIEDTELFNLPRLVECRPDLHYTETGQGSSRYPYKFSPRRHHALLSYTNRLEGINYLYLLGGRSRVLIDFPDGWERVHGGFTERLVDSERQEHLREETALMNDIWVSPPEANTEFVVGEDWKLVNPGCITQYHPYTLPAEPQLWGNGSKNAQCDTDDDCGGDASCDGQRHTCICNIWSPREQFAATIYKERMYVSGGFVWLQMHPCGQFSCGGGFRTVVNDVWYSDISLGFGVGWSNEGLGTAEALWEPRAGHQFMVPTYSELYAQNLDGNINSYLYMTGGQSISTTESGTTKYYNDIWHTSDGKNWILKWAQSSNQSYPARTSHYAVMLDDVMVVTKGYDQNGAKKDTWVWDNSASSLTSDRFIEDFTEGSIFEEYVNKDSPVSVIPFVTRVNEEKLNSLDIYTVEDLAGLAESDFSKIKILQDFNQLDYPDICLHIKWAESILDNCNPEPENLDYVDWDGVFIRDGGWDSKLKINQTKSEATISEEIDYCTQMFVEWTGSWTRYILFDQEKPYPFPLKCKTEVESLAMPTGALFQDRLWIIGGLVDNGPSSEKTANVWYREPSIPATSFVTTPRTMTSDDVFEFSCSDSFSSWCRYQYRILNMDASPPVEVRHWCDSPYQMSYGAYWKGGWLPKGYYMLQVRAIGPSGNKESFFQEGRNQWTWHYIPEPPWDLIISLICLFVLIVAAIIFYERYKARKAALQRYAMKRMRRKFKRMQKIKAGKLHKDRKERILAQKDDAITKGVEINTKKEQKESVEPNRRRRRRGPVVGPSLQSNGAVNTSL